MAIWPVAMRRQACSRLSKPPTRSDAPSLGAHESERHARSPEHAGRRSCGIAILILLLACGTVPAYAAPPSLDPSGGYWLLDIAWDQAAGLAQAPSRTDLVELLCLLQSATRQDPRLAQAYRQQYDLLASQGRQAEATQALGKHIELSPDDEPAWLTYLARQVAAAQTAEQRLAACERFLARKDVPAPAVCWLSRTAAEILVNRLQTDRALQYAQQAVRAFPYDIAAQRLLLDLRGRSGPIADLQVAIWSVRRNPADTGSLVQIAWLADSLRLYDQADTCYAAAEEITKKFGQDATGLAIRVADHWLDSGKPEQAVSRLITLTGRPDAPAESWLLLAEAYLMLDKPDDARLAAMRALNNLAPAPAAASLAAATRPVATNQSATTRAATSPAAAAPASRPANVGADWVRTMYLGQAADALDDARTTFESHPDQLATRRTYGWALLRTGKPDQAIQVLTSIADVDPWSALGLVEALHAREDRISAFERLRILQRLSPSGPVWRETRRWAKSVGVEPPAPDGLLVRDAKMLLAGFNRKILRLPLAPDEFLQLKLTLEPVPPPGMPWFGTLELTNISDQPIYLGSDGVVVPNVLVSAVVYDPAAHDAGQRMLLSLHRRIVLEPGKSISLHRPIDSGPVRQVLRNPYRDVTVTFTTMLDPVRTTTGSWQAGPAGVTAEPVSSERRASGPVRAEDLLQLVRTGSASQKIDLARQAACMLVGLQAQPAAQTQPARPSADSLNQVLAALLQDKNPLVAAYALAQADLVPLAPQLAQAAAPQVGADSWLSRLLAVRLFSHKQGENFARALSGMSTTDPDPLVRQLAATYYASFQAGQKLP